MDNGVWRLSCENRLVFCWMFGSSFESEGEDGAGSPGRPSILEWNAMLFRISTIHRS
jgi:hypothetical protein